MEHTTKNAPAATEAAVQKTYTGNINFNHQLAQISYMLMTIAATIVVPVIAGLLIIAEVLL